MALTKISTDGFKDDAVTTDKLANSINTDIAANTAKVQTTINNNADNRIITGSGTANTLEGEDKFTWNGNNLHVERTVTAYEQPLVNIYNSGAYGWGGAIRFSANWANTEEHQATIKTYGGSSATGASLAFNVGAANSEKLRIQNGGGISFNGDTAAANALDDYEEGTFTPFYNYSGRSFVYYLQSGSYVKIGKTVHYILAIGTSSTSGSGASGPVKIDGLPFTSNARAAVAIRATNFASDPARTATVENNATHMELIKQSSTGTNDMTGASLSTGNYGNIVYAAGNYETNS